MPHPAPAPASTYRLQISPDFTLVDAAARIPYLSRLGADWVYLSPILRAEPGSAHGYDVVDPTEVDPARGGRNGLLALASAAHAAGMGVLVDIVPNHMGVATPLHNRYWWDVLQHGEQSRWAHWFDIDWDAGELVLAELGSAEDLERLRIVDHDGSPALALHDLLLPVAPGTHRPGMSAQELHALQHYRLVPWQHEDWELTHRRFFSIKTLAGLRVEDPRVFEETHSEIASWFHEGLVDGLRIDHIDGLARPQEYLQRLHALTGAYIVTEKILAIDRDSPELFPELREVIRPEWTGVGAAGTTGYELIAAIDGALTDRSGFFQLEALRQQLETNGSPAAPEAAAERRATARRLRRHPTSVQGLFTQIEQAAKAQFSFGPLTAEMLRLARELTASGWEHCTPAVQQAFGTDPVDLDMWQLADVFAVLASSLPVYRVYAPLPSDSAHALAQLNEGDTASLPPLSVDGQLVLRAVSAVRSTARSAAASDRLLAYLGAVLTTPGHPVLERFAQTTGAVMAKGVEDTSFYRYAALTALNEVGGHPAEPATPDMLTAELALRARTTPWGLNSLTTHDTKRSEDARARILALAEIPEEFTAALFELRRHAPVHYGTADSGLQIAEQHDFGMNASIQSARPDHPADASFDILLWQAVVGAWPASAERLEEYALKAAREHGVHTTWTAPNTELEAQLRAAMQTTAHAPAVRRILEALDSRIAAAGFSNALSAKALQLLAPGVPDVYQGTELWDRSLVDPDNRRAVDFDVRERMLDRLGPAPAAPPTAQDWETGAVKLHLTRALLHLRTRHRALFSTAPLPMRCTGKHHEHALTYRFGDDIILLATRLPLGLQAGGSWQDTAITLPAAQQCDVMWRDVLTGTRFRSGAAELSELLAVLPVAVLERME